jgi:L-lactate dehydrogenase complex protein LldG
VVTEPDWKLADDAAGLLVRFTAEAERAASVVHQCLGIEAVVDLVVELAARGQVTAGGPVAAGGQISVSATAAARYPELVTRLAETLPVAQPTTPHEAAAGTVGVSSAEALVAETGSLLVAEPTLGDRLVSMLSPILVQIVPAEMVLPTLDDVGSLLSERLRCGRTNYYALMTGPSRSADIERSLTIGVQGPYELHIAILHSTGTEMPQR